MGRKNLLLDEKDLASTAIALQDGSGAWKGFGVRSNMLQGMNILNWGKSAAQKALAKIAEGWQWISNPQRIEDARNAGRNIWERITGAVRGAIEGIQNAGDFLGQWLQDDPIGAIAGIVGVGLVGGVGAGLILGAKGIIAGGLGVGKLVKGIWGLIKANKIKTLFTVAAIPAMASWVVDATQEIWHFDWNQTDEDLLQEVQNAWDSIYGILGDAAGRIVGQACGIIPGIVTVTVNPRLMLQMKEALGIEAYDAVLDGLYSIFQFSKRLFGTWMFSHAYINSRKAIKWAVRSNLWGLRQILPQRWVEGIDQWGAKGSKPWTFAQQYENWVDSIEHRGTREFVENFSDSAFEACGESWLVWANAFV